jgi:hypothetical protein
MDRRILLGGGIIVAAVAVVGIRMAVNTGAKTGLDDALNHLPPGYTATHGAVAYNAITGEATVRDLTVSKNGATLFTAGNVAVSGIGAMDGSGTPKHIGSVVLHDASGGPYQHIDRIDLTGLSLANLRDVMDAAAYPGGKPAWTDKRPILDHLAVHGVSGTQAYPAPANQPPGTPGGDAKFAVGTLTIDGLRMAQLPAPPDLAGNPALVSVAIEQSMAEDSGSLKDMTVTVTGRTPATIRIADIATGHFDSGKVDVMSLDGLTMTTAKPAGTTTVAGLSLHGMDFSRMLALMPTVVADPGKPHPEILNGMHVDNGEMHGLRVDYPDGPLVTIDSMNGGSTAPGLGNFTMHALTVQTSNRPLQPSARAALNNFGMADFTTDLSEAGGYDPASQKFTLKHCDIDVHGLGVLHWSFELSGLAPTPMTTPAAIQEAVQAAKLDALSLRWDDASLTGRLMKMEAAKQGVGPEQLRASLAMPLASLPILMPQQPDAAQQVNAFLNGQHSLTITLTPPAPVGLADWKSTPMPAKAALLGVRISGN